MHNIILVILYNFYFWKNRVYSESYLLVQLECVGLHESQKSNTLSNKKCSEEK